MIIKAYLLRGDKLDSFNIDINDNNYNKVKKKLIQVNNQIVNLLKKYQEEGKIKSIFRPKNKQMKDHLNELVDAKKNIKLSLKKIRNLYY